MMHLTAHAIGGVMGLAFVTVGANVTESVFEPSTGISIVSLTPLNVNGEPSIVQDRFISGQGVLVAKWEAEIRNTVTGEKICSGSGYWDYSSGRATKALKVDEWVGEAGCFANKIEPDVTMQACARYMWADQQTAQCSLGFDMRDLAATE